MKQESDFTYQHVYKQLNDTKSCYQIITIIEKLSSHWFFYFTVNSEK